MLKNKSGILGEMFFRLSRFYVGLGHDLLYYKKIYLLGKENIPESGTPTIIASNHQNALNDALALVFGFKDRPVSIFTRGDLFGKPLLAKMLRAFYLLPAYRLGVEVQDSADKNFDVFAEAGERILEGGTVMLFPEAVNQDKRWLGEFSQGYIRLAFDAAKKADFKTDIVILPMINHYSDYFHFREDMLLEVGKPVSLKDYYELYQTKPRTAQRNVNAEVRRQIESMMLNITDLDNYEAIDFIRETYGNKYCSDCGGNRLFLPDGLRSDRALVEELNAYGKENPDDLSKIYSDALLIKQESEKYKVKDKNFDKKFSLARFSMQIFALIALFPLFVLSLIPNILLFLSPFPITNKLKKGDGHARMFVGGVRFALNMLLVAPLVYGIHFVVEGLLWSWIAAAVHTICLPVLGLLAWNYRKLFISTKREYRFNKAKANGLKAIIELRKNLFLKLDNILNKNTWKKE